MNDRVDILNERIDLLKEKEGAVLEQLNEIKKQTQNVSNEKLNKLPKSWPYSTYLCDYLHCNTIVEHLKFLIPTALVKLEISGTAHGPFKAMLDTGAQPAMISAALFNTIKCQTATAKRKLVGIDSRPFLIKKKFVARIKPWFESDIAISETVWVYYRNSMLGIQCYQVLN